MWKDATSGVREIPLERDAQGVLLTVTMDRATRRSADGRWPVDNGTSCSNAAVYQVRTASVGSQRHPARSSTPTAHILETEELTILTAWAEGVSEAAAHAPERVDALLAGARTGAAWRAAFGLPEPSPRLGDALESLGRTVHAAALTPGTSFFDELLTALSEPHPDEARLDKLVRQSLLAMLEARGTRHQAITRGPPDIVTARAERTVPVFYVRDGHDLVATSEDFGLAAASWPGNLRADPYVTIQISTTSGRSGARSSHVVPSRS